MNWKKTLSVLYNSVTSTRAAGLYILLFAIAIGTATFVENDFGTSAAQKVIFKARWFEALLVLFGLSIFANIIRFRMIKQKKWAALIFHAAIIIIIIGAGITRYIGTEGMMHIRENGSSNTILSSETYLNFRFQDKGKSYSFSEPVYFASLGKNKFDETYQIGNNLFQVRLKDFIPNPKEELVTSENATAVIKIVVAGPGGREEYFVRQGERQTIHNTNFNFTNSVLPNAYNIFYSNDSLSFITDREISQMVMATQQRDVIPAGTKALLQLRAMYSYGAETGFVFGDFNAKGETKLISENLKMKNESYAGLVLEVTHNGKTDEILVAGRKGEQGQPRPIPVGSGNLAISYGSMEVKLPFEIRLRDFIMERYPGTDNPSSYASEVTVVDPANGVNMNFRIFMNNILDYGGYRFFQSSFDQDEAGTILSVNHDFIGTWVSYIGYILLTIGLIFTFFHKKSRFQYLSQKLNAQKGSSVKTLLILLIATLGVNMTSMAQTGQPPMKIDKALAREFGKIVVQDHKGRLKPVNTMTSEVIRKLSRKESLFGYTSDQIFLAMLSAPADWEGVQLIYVTDHPQLKELIGTSDKYVSYRQFFDQEGQYKLRDIIRQSQMMNPKDQGTFEKAVIKTDEKVNIANMVFSGRLLKIFPIPDDPGNTWISPADVREAPSIPPVIADMNQIFINYMTTFQQGGQDPQGQINKISEFQKKYAAAIYPSDSKIGAEILLNRLDIFGKLKNIYGLGALIILGLFFYTVFSTRANKKRITKIVFLTLCVTFAFQTLGLALRWYVSGRAPWSNGYESMIYISWTTMLAGLIFSRKSLGGMAATTVLSATVLLVAAMSWLDPEISPLVPVLKSYWLTIHVSLEAGSYGFLMLGAVIGMLNLIQYAITSRAKKATIERSIKELTMISEITLLAGLVMVSIGTYLGGVWANESWGRYWGWDAKETWALVTILVYAFILHMRFIPGLQSTFAFNIASLFGFATVIMTYFGVNYYLSGLHSYAAGDPVPIPTQVYYTVICLFILSIGAYINYRRVYLTKK